MARQRRYGRNYGAHRRHSAYRRGGTGGRQGLVCFYILLCLGLIGSIVYMQWRMGNLREVQARLSEFLQQQTADQTGEGLEDAAQEPMGTVRVLLLENDTDTYRDSVGIVGDAGCVLDDGTRQWTSAPEEVVSFGAENLASFTGTTVVTPAEGGYLYLVDETGARQQPGYRGTLEVWQDANGYALVNEVSTEDYLACVLPSEMHESYGLEALKAQAVCARSYLYAQTSQEHYPQFHAQLDDTVSFQVYNHEASGALSAQAVRETAGQVLMCQGQIVNALYYSTSCGFSQSGSIFGEDEQVFQSVYVGSGEAPQDFDSYIRGWDENAYERDERYFRWVAVIDVAGRTADIIDAVTDLKKKDGEDVVYSDSLKRRISDRKIATAAEAFGELKSFQVVKRNAGGVIEEARLEFACGTVDATGELHIRDILGAAQTSVQLQNGEIVTGIDRLYSAAFVLDAQDGQWILRGGGCGHGAGMSQNGAKALAAEGWGCQDILHFFYQNVDIVRLSQ